MESPQSKQSIESLLKLLSLVYLILVTSGLVYNYYFYKQFGIIITEYIDLSDALLLFLPLLADYFILIILFILMTHFLIKTIFLKTDSPYFDQQKKILKSMHLKFFLISLGIIIVLYIMTLFNVNVFRAFYMWTMLTIIMFLPFLLEIGFNFIAESYKIFLPILFRDTLYTIIIIISIVVWTSYSRAEKVKRKSGYKNFHIVFNNGDPSFQSDSTIYYLGRTKKYLFIFDFKVRKSNVLNVDDIKQINFSPE